MYKGQKVGQTIREALTHLDPDKKAASRKRRAMNKAKRCFRDSDDQWQGNYPPDDVKSLSKESSCSQTTLDSSTSIAAMETHPLESLLVAMAVQRDRDNNIATNAVHDNVFSEDCLSSPSNHGRVAVVQAPHDDGCGQSIGSSKPGSVTVEFAY
jgi:hypothetical protein